jgi:hypothetical protein
MPGLLAPPRRSIFSSLGFRSSVDAAVGHRVVAMLAAMRRERVSPDLWRSDRGHRVAIETGHVDVRSLTVPPLEECSPSSISTWCCDVAVEEAWHVAISLRCDATGYCRTSAFILKSRSLCRAWHNIVSRHPCARCQRIDAESRSGIAALSSGRSRGYRTLLQHLLAVLLVG